MIHIEKDVSDNYILTNKRGCLLSRQPVKVLTVMIFVHPEDTGF